MKNILFLASAILVFSSVSHATLLGTWHGNLTYENKACDAINIEVSELNNELAIVASGDQFIHCGASAFLLDENYGIQGRDLYKYNIKMGSISDTAILGRERSYDINGYWRFWDFIQLTQNSDGTMAVKLNFGDEYSLSGTFTKN
jgi:hypothetical protein